MARRRVGKGRMASVESEPILNPTIVGQIEKVLDNWDTAPTAVKERFERAHRKVAKEFESKFTAIADSERLTEADFAIRINTRD